MTCFKHLGKRTMDHKVQPHPEPLSYSLVSWYAHLCAFTFRPLIHAKSAMISSWPLVVLSFEYELSQRTLLKQAAEYCNKCIPMVPKGPWICPKGLNAIEKFLPRSISCKYRTIGLHSKIRNWKNDMLGIRLITLPNQRSEKLPAYGSIILCLRDIKKNNLETIL